MTHPIDVSEPDASQLRPWRTVGVLTLIYTYAFIDRTVLSLLVEPIKADLNLSDSQMSLLLGLAFVAFYSVLNIPAGYLVDRFSRKRIIGVSAIAWSAATMACGFAQNFLQLFVGRAGVGLAEATVGPASFSLIRDEVPEQKRSRAFSIFAAGPFLGSALSMILGGMILGAAQSDAFAGIPILGSAKPWQAVLIIIGAVGAPIALLSLLLPERRKAAAGADNRITFKAAAGHMWVHCPLYGALIAYVTFSAMIAFGKNAWIPAMMGRNHGLQPSEIGPTLGLINLIVAPIGLLIGGFIMDRLTATGRDMKLYGMVAAFLTMVGMVALPLMPDARSAWIAYGFGSMFIGAFYPVGAMVLAQATPAAMMGKVTAAYMLLQGVISQAFGPLIVALVAETLFESDGRFAIGHAMAATGVAVGLLSMVSLALLMRRIDQASVA